MQFQLWMRDEYGQNSILETSENIVKISTRMNVEINNLNVDNALAAGEKLLNWEGYTIYIYGDVGNSRVIYGGKTTTNKHEFVDIITGKIISLEEALDMVGNGYVKIFLGNLDGEEWFAKDLVTKQEINNIEWEELKGKTVFFIKVF